MVGVEKSAFSSQVEPLLARSDRFAHQKLLIESLQPQVNVVTVGWVFNARFGENCCYISVLKCYS
ncbi:hypothetical protein J6590_032764 [Homalodisca vitripennis]|nr:hypothetical protein J6590_032764 [Homalodisca vitripennis]